MDGNFQERLYSIKTKAQLLTESYHIATAERDKALQRVEELEKELTNARQQIEELSTRVEYLKLAATMEISQGDVEKSRKFLSDLVWEIDKCISQLSE